MVGCFERAITPEGAGRLKNVLPRWPRVSNVHHRDVAGGLALSVLAVMHKESMDSRSRESLAIKQDSFILLHQQPCAIQDSGIRPRNSD